MPWQRHLYPDNWDKIATQIKKDAGWKCERCGHPHDPAAGRTLTVHHLDSNPQNCQPENLAALCQACHLHIQKTLLPGQIIMPFACEPWMEGKSIRVYQALR